MSLYTCRNKRLVRPDGYAKVTGSLKYLTDLSFPNMLYGKILRSPYAHAKIISICTEHAKELKGVRAVVTHQDVPGMNRFGLVIPDQPVFCEEKVRYIGDAIAAVAAETEEIAKKALELIEVIYEPLPVIDDPEQALCDDAPKLHPTGNILHRATYQNGNIEDGFNKCSTIIDEMYEVPRQIHAYMETEGGIIVPERDGSITVYVGTQHGYKDRFQLSRILAMPETSIRVVSSPIGGSFGGKDELNIQPYGALLAIVTGSPVKIHQSRRESIRSGIKRHPMRMQMKTGANVQGKILAHEVNIIADTGAYATLGPAVLDFAVEHAAGPYIIPNIDIKGQSIYTNNGVSGEFRGFGGNQITFALEGQMDRLAEKLEMDPLELRKRNIRNAKNLGPLGQRIAPTNGAIEVLETIQKSISENNAKKASYQAINRTGTGIAIAMHGGGLGFGRLDPAGGCLSLSTDGKIEILFGFEEFGQGIESVIENLLTEELNCSPEDIRIIIGDTARVPSSGSSTASRGTNMIWQAIQRMKGSFKQQLLKKASHMLNIPIKKLYLGPGGIWSQDDVTNYPCITYPQLAQRGFIENPLSVNTHFHFPTTPDAVNGGHFLYSFGAVMVQVEIDLLTGKIKVIKINHVIAAGPVVSPQGYLGQIEGGGVMGLGYALMEDALMQQGQYITDNLDSYLIPSIRDVPITMNVHAIETLYEGDPYGPRGVGEIGGIAIAPAIVKAIHDAIGYWVCRLPVSPEEILHAIEVRGIKK